ncbi:hypothetical protein Tco_1174211 [Tanacetum coccineum]
MDIFNLAPTLQRRLIKANPPTAKDAWHQVEKKFLDNKRTRTIALKGIQMGDLSADAHFCKIESIVTLWNDLGSSMTDDDIIEFSADYEKHDTVERINYESNMGIDSKFNSFALGSTNNTVFCQCHGTFKLDIDEANSPKLLSWIWKGMKWMANNPKVFKEPSPTTDAVMRLQPRYSEKSEKDSSGCSYYTLASPKLTDRMLIGTKVFLPRVALEDEEMVQGKYEQEYEKYLSDSGIPNHGGNNTFEVTVELKVKKGELRPPKLKTEDPNKSCSKTCNKEDNIPLLKSYCNAEEYNIFEF